MKKYLFLCLFLSIGTILSTTIADEKITLEDLLDEIISFDETVYFPNYTCLQESSYDRRSIAPDAPGWWANDDGFGYIRTDITDGRSEKVLFDQSGPGVITRIWITTQNKRGTLRFYFDGSASPGWIVPAYDFVRFGISMDKGLCQPHTSYSAAEHEKGGSTFFLPIPYASGCKITLEEPDPNAAPPRYYQVNYRKYPKNTLIETFSSEVAERASAKIKEADNMLLNPPTFDQGTVLADNKLLTPQQALDINLPDGKNAVRTITLKVDLENPELYAQVMRELILETEFDGKKTSWIPLGDFSGGGMGAPYVKSWYLDANGQGKIVSRWVMPYKENGNISLTNYSGENVQVSMTINTAPFEWNDRTLYFHCSWKQALKIPLVTCYDPNNGSDWNFALINGKGVYRGDVLSLFNYSERWYGEGDEKIWVDDDVFPSHFGTGTEDYYNSSWAPVVPFHTPFGGAPRADKASSKGYNTFFRTRNLDAIPFQEQFKFDIEMLSWDPGSVNYSTTIYWYGDYDAKAQNLSGAEEATRLLPDPGLYKITDCLEFETYPILDRSDVFDVGVQDMSGFSGGLWSGDKQLLFKNGKQDDYVTFRFENLKQVKQRLVLHLTKANDFGIFSFTVNGELSPVTFDGYATSVIHSGPVNIGEYIPDQDGVIELKITLTGTNPKTQGFRYLIGLDCIQIIEDPENYNVSDCIEFEGLTPYSKSNNLTINEQVMFDNYPGGKWSNKKQMVALSGTVGNSIEYRFGNLPPVEQNVVIYATKGNDFGTLSFTINGKKVTKLFDGYSPFVTHSGPIHLGTFLPDEDGNITLKAAIVSTNSKTISPRYIVGLDCIQIKKKAGLEPSVVKTLKHINCSILLTSAQIKVQSDESIAMLSLFDINGILVAQEKRSDILNVSYLSKGIYLLEVAWQKNDKSVFKVLI